MAALIAEVKRLQHIDTPTNTPRDNTATKLLNDRLRTVRGNLILDKQEYQQQLKVAALKQTKKAVNEAKDTADWIQKKECEIADLTTTLTVLQSLL